MSLVRELGAAERIYCREQIDHGNQTLVQALVLSKTIQIDEFKAREALLQLYEEFCPMLGYEVSPSEDQTTLFYKAKEKQRAEEDLLTNFTYEQGKDWRQLFENELNLPFNNSNLYRWIMVDGHVIIMSFHHATVDAKNLYYVGRQYVALCLSQLDDQKLGKHLDAMEKYLFDRYCYEPISDADLVPRAERPDPIQSLTSVRDFHIPNPILARLQTHCRQHNIRLNSILTVISAIGHYLACDSKDEKTLKIHMMVNIRPQLGLDFHSTGMFVTVFDCFVSIDEHYLDSLWSKAIEQHTDLHRRIKDKEYIANCKNDSDLLKLINANESFSCDDVHFAFSNLGLLPNLKDDPIEEHYFGVSLIEQRWTSSILLGISTVHENLCFTITYNQNQVPTEFIEKWIEKIYLVLKQI